jgi:hypothetical protein
MESSTKGLGLQGPGLPVTRAAYFRDTMLPCLVEGIESGFPGLKNTYIGLYFSCSKEAIMRL